MDVYSILLLLGHKQKYIMADKKYVTKSKSSGMNIPIQVVGFRGTDIFWKEIPLEIVKELNKMQRNIQSMFNHEVCLMGGSVLHLLFRGTKYESKFPLNDLDWKINCTKVGEAKMLMHAFTRLEISIPFGDLVYKCDRLLYDCEGITFMVKKKSGNILGKDKLKVDISFDGECDEDFHMNRASLVFGEKTFPTIHIEHNGVIELFNYLQSTPLPLLIKLNKKNMLSSLGRVIKMFDKGGHVIGFRRYAVDEDQKCCECKQKPEKWGKMIENVVAILECKCIVCQQCIYKKLPPFPRRKIFFSGDEEKKETDRSQQKCHLYDPLRNAELKLCSRHGSGIPEFKICKLWKPDEVVKVLHLQKL